MNRISQIYREAKEPFNALWKWARGHVKRWRALVGWSDRNIRQARKTLKDQHKKWKLDKEELEVQRKRLDQAHKDLVQNRKRLQETDDNSRRHALRKRREELLAIVKDASVRIEANLDQREQGKKDISNAKQRIKFWLKKRTAYRKQWKAARKRHNKGERGKFEEWMLNGHSGNIDESLKPVIAFLVVECNQTITSTTGGSHSSTSYHYPYNNSDNEGHAIDSAGPDMCGAQKASTARFGNGWLELYGPCPWYIKHGTVYDGYFPAHGDHCHHAKA